MKELLANKGKITLAGIYFKLSVVITSWFIFCGSDLYHFDRQKMILSCCIAGGKWGVQLLLALVLLKEKRWVFINQVGLTCFAGSCMLLPYCIPQLRNLIPGNAFLLSLIAAVTLMIVLYYRSVRVAQVPVRWFFLWLGCLATAITLQLTVVF
jgi:hypothetical protein